MTDNLLDAAQRELDSVFDDLKNPKISLLRTKALYRRVRELTVVIAAQAKDQGVPGAIL